MRMFYQQHVRESAVIESFWKALSLGFAMFVYLLEKRKQG